MTSPTLRPPRNSISPRAIVWWRWRGGIWTLTAGALAALPALFGAPATRVWWSVAAVIVLGGVVVTAVAPTRRFRCHRWELTDGAVYASSGWWWRESRIAPLSRVQTVDSRRGPLQRALGLSSVTVTTASAMGPVTVVGLDHRDAVDLVEQVAIRTQEAPGDAT